MNPLPEFTGLGECEVCRRRDVLVATVSTKGAYGQEYSAVLCGDCEFTDLSKEPSMPATPAVLSPFPPEQTLRRLTKMLVESEARVRRTRMAAANANQLIHFAEHERQTILDSISAFWAEQEEKAGR